MAEENRVVLHGFWASPYVKRVELALKIKGIPFDYVSEDLINKSASLLKYNPINKKVPVLVHNGKPIVESLIILQYIEETWNNEPRLLPQDPYARARVRLWAGYIDQLLGSLGKLYNAEGKEALDKAHEETLEKLAVLEEGCKNFFSKNPRSDDQNLDLLDIMIISALGSKVYEEILGFKILDSEKHPFIFQWVTILMEMPVVKENMPPLEDLVSLIQGFKQKGYKNRP